MRKYMDSSLTPGERARDLLERMSVREKAGQLNQRLYGFNAYKKEGGQILISDEFMEEVRKWGGLGLLYGLYRADPWSGRNYENGLTGSDITKTYNMLQSYVIENSRFHIPMLLTSECPHGHQALDGYLLPVNLAMGASFNEALVGEAYHVCGRQMKEMGVDMALISMLDILRDPRWGRSEECFGEDPYLASVMAKAVTEAVQAEGVMVVAKHFAAQGETTGGVNASAARIGERELREIHFPAMKAAVQAGAGGVMAAYNEIDGLPCHANRWLLHHVLREEMGFKGIVMADGFAVDRLSFLGKNSTECGALAINSGVDVSLWDDGFTKLEKAFEQGLISEKRLDEAVFKVLSLKFERGLFEYPYLGENGKAYGQGYSLPENDANLKLARESAVLLKNKDGLLPVKAKDGAPLKIALIGPNIRDIYSQLGDYTPPVMSGSTIEQGIKWAAGQYKNVTLQIYGCETKADMNKGTVLEDARALACASDITILALGGSSSRFMGTAFDKNGAAIAGAGRSGQNTEMDCGEGIDLSSLKLPKFQQRLAEAVLPAAKKSIALIIAGRPYDISEINRQSDAVIYSFYPGPKGGQALAELIFGMMAPSGRLPASLPRSGSRLPVYYNHRISYEAMHYCDGEDGPLYPFGWGLNYTSLNYGGFALKETMSGWDIVMTVKNNGSDSAFAVPMLFVSRKGGTVVPRKAELKGFKKCSIAPGSEKEIRMTLAKASLGIVNAQMQETSEQGKLLLEIKDGSMKLWKSEIDLV